MGTFTSIGYLVKKKTTQANGEIYDGEWKDNCKHGSGMWRGSRNDSYIGEWKMGKADGFGVHTWTNGDRYEGEFQSCLKHGLGTERFCNGDMYVGTYEHGKPEGYGEYFWKNQNVYKGYFVNGLRHGRGIWRAKKDGGDSYDGEYKNDKKCGWGEYSWESGNIFRGNFENDLRHGYGEMYYTDGRIYKGYWMNGLQVGEVDVNNPAQLSAWIAQMQRQAFAVPGFHSVATPQQTLYNPTAVQGERGTQSSYIQDKSRVKSDTSTKKKNSLVSTPQTQNSEVRVHSGARRARASSFLNSTAQFHPSPSPSSREQTPGSRLNVFRDILSGRCSREKNNMTIQQNNTSDEYFKNHHTIENSSDHVPLGVRYQHCTIDNSNTMYRTRVVKGNNQQTIKQRFLQNNALVSENQQKKGTRKLGSSFAANKQMVYLPAIAAPPAFSRSTRHSRDQGTAELFQSRQVNAQNERRHATLEPEAHRQNTQHTRNKTDFRRDESEIENSNVKHFAYYTDQEELQGVLKARRQLVQSGDEGASNGDDDDDNNDENISDLYVLRRRMSPNNINLCNSCKRIKSASKDVQLKKIYASENQVTKRSQENGFGKRPVWKPAGLLGNNLYSPRDNGTALLYGQERTIRKASPSGEY